VNLLKQTPTHHHGLCHATTHAQERRARTRGVGPEHAGLDAHEVLVRGVTPGAQRRLIHAHAHTRACQREGQLLMHVAAMWQY
jgi:hypothetical protein